MSHEHINPQGTEASQRPESILRPGRVITTDEVYYDNVSLQAYENRIKWQESKKLGEMHAVAGCGDARNILTEPEKSYSVLSIAAGIPVYPEIMKHEGVRDIVVFTHFDGDTLIPGETPTGCGGQGAKDEMMKKGIPVVDGILNYIHNKVKTPDIVVQSILKAEELAKKSDKPVLAGTQDHLTGELHPLAAFWRKNGTMLSAMSDSLDPKLLTPENANPAELYRNGIPSLDYRSLQETGFSMFYEYMLSNQRLVRTLEQKYPNLRERQKVQNPDVLIISTSPQPAKLRYPTTFAEPGSYVKLSVLRDKDNDGGGRITQESIGEAIDQAQYFISHAVDNHGDLTKPFSRLGTVLFETSNMELSRALAREASRRSWMQDWRSHSEHHVIGIENKGGQALDVVNIF